VGASIDFHLLATQPGPIAGLVFGALAVKFAILVLLARLFRMSTDQGLLFAFSLPQVGEFGFVLLSFGAGLGLFGPAVADPLVAVVALSTAASPLLMLLFERVIRPRVGTAEKTILARAIDRPDAYALMDAGVQHVYRETFDSSLRLGVQALRLLGRRAYHAERAARTFRRHDDEALDELRAVRQDREAYLGVARRRIADLERTLLADLTEKKETDAGWDSESLREDVLSRPASPSDDSAPEPSKT
jgi:hypothetical protein